jgi:hypothetical protein
MDRVLQQRGRAASMYLNRRVEHREDLRSYTSFLDQPKEAARAAGSRAASKLGDLALRTSPGLVDIVKQAREKNHAEGGASEALEGSRKGSAGGEVDGEGKEGEKAASA